MAPIQRQINRATGVTNPNRATLGRLRSIIQQRSSMT